MDHKIKFPSDFLKVNEPKLSSNCDKFDTSCKWFKNDLTFVKTLLNEEFALDDADGCKERVKSFVCDEKISEEYDEVRQELSTLQKFKTEVEREVRRLSHVPAKLTDIDDELLCRSAKERKLILTDRLIMLERTKSLCQKVLKHLARESETYQNRLQQPVVDAKVHEHLVKARKSSEKKLESQLNAEVQRIQKAFADKFTKASKPKLLFERIDWKMRTEIMPTRRTKSSSGTNSCPK